MGDCLDRFYPNVHDCNDDRYDRIRIVRRKVSAASEKTENSILLRKFHRFQQNQITRFVLAVIVANSNAIFPNNNANPAITLMTWNPRGIVITPKIAIPKIIAGNIRFRFRLRASPFPEVLF